MISAIDRRLFEVLKSSDISKIFTLNDARNMKTISEKRSLLDIYSSNLISTNLMYFIMAKIKDIEKHDFYKINSSHCFITAS